jgi:hypothetical protein
MVTFKGEPNMLVRLNPPIGNIKMVRFNANGEITTENERVIQRLYHKFDSVPAEGAEPAVEVGDDLELLEQQDEPKSFCCKKCEFTTDSRGLLMSHYRSEHPKEEEA